MTKGIAAMMMTTIARSKRVSMGVLRVENISFGG
jgi:hypothetical protein